MRRAAAERIEFRTAIDQRASIHPMPVSCMDGRTDGCPLVQLDCCTCVCVNARSSWRDSFGDLFHLGIVAVVGNQLTAGHTVA